ncbi:hypothetical protein [Stenotrophomonas sepilia]|uniref:hypothetical protein n=1 Tax=Stenotrophomonas sepilia TaxID=2860290 RepID=UPI0033412BE7
MMPFVVAKGCDIVVSIWVGYLMNAKGESFNMDSVDFKSLVVQVVGDYFGAKKKGMLLSQIGQALTKQGVDLHAALAGRRLSEFISKELSDSISLVVSPVDRKIVSAVPLASKSAASEVLKADLESPVVPIPRIAPAVWAAFTKPLQSGLVRLLDVERLSFSDSSETDVGGVAFCIREGDILEKGSALSRSQYEREVFQRIISWINGHGIDLVRVTAAGASLRQSNERKSLYESILDRLSEDQRKRVLLPLDVIELLSRR